MAVKPTIRQSTNHLTSEAVGEAADLRAKIARLGLVGKGLLYAVLGLLAVDIATGSGDASTRGAIERVASQPFGQVLLVVLTVSLVALVAWKGLQAIAGDPVDGEEPFDRLVNAIKGVSYLGFAIAAVSVLVANWGGSTGSAGQGDTKEQATATVLGLPGGQFLVVAAGLAIVAFGLLEIYKHAVEAEFLQRLALSEADQTTEQGIETAGRIGYAASGAVTVLVGGFLVVAGVQHDPDDTKGISGVLQELSGTGAGQIALWAMAAGLVFFGAFCLAEAKFRRAT